MATSPNGWPVSPDPGVIDITPLEVGGVAFTPGIRGGRVHDVLKYVATAVHSRVQPISASYGNYGYSYRANVNDPSVWSNHASGTAIDYNATKNANGVPTASIWTQAQINEVHAILAEVDNVVRWGGDYSGTPDSMHFEIDVTPAELEGSSFEFPVAATRWPIGAPGPYWEGGVTYPILTEMSVSYPTMAAWSPLGRAFWQFTAQETGRISVDALLSHWVTDDFSNQVGEPTELPPEGPQVTLFIYKYLPNGQLSFVGQSSSFTGGFGYPPRNQGRILFETEAGATYFIYTEASREWPYIRTVVRIGDYAEEPEWVQPPDQVRVWAHEDGSHGTEPSRKDFDDVVHDTTNFIGNDFSITRAFDGESPAVVPAAVLCGWRWARRMDANAGVQWWSPDWSSNAMGAGGVCRPLSHSANDMESGHVNSIQQMFCGWQYHADPGSFGFADNIDWTCYAGSQVFFPQTVVTLEKKTGTGIDFPNSAVPYLPEVGANESIVWESTTCTLIDVDVCIDNIFDPPTTGHTVSAQLYAGEYIDPFENEHEEGKWEPWDYGSWFGQPGDTPENFAASQDDILSTTGTPTSWQNLNAVHWRDGIELTDPLLNVRFTLIGSGQLVDDPPHPVGGVLSEFEEGHFTVYTAVRTTVRPSRYKFYEDPGIPDIDWAGVNAIALGQDDAGQILH